MIVVMAASLQANLTINPLEPATTITTQIVTALTGDTEFDNPKTLVAFALGLTLFFITLFLNYFALKIIQNDWLERDPNAAKQIENEFNIQSNLNHPGINKVIEYGTNGFFIKKDGSKVENLTYLILDYI